MKYLKTMEAFLQNESYFEHQDEVLKVLQDYQNDLIEEPINDVNDVRYHMQNLRTLHSDMEIWEQIEQEVENALVDMIRESSGDNPEMSTDIKNEYSKIKEGPKGGVIDIGIVDLVADATLKNLKREYPDGIIKIVNGRYIMKLKI